MEIIKYQCPRWRLKKEREDRRGAAEPGSGSRAPSPGAAARDFTPSARSCWGSPRPGQAPPGEGLAAEGSAGPHFPEKCRS